MYYTQHYSSEHRCRRASPLPRGHGFARRLQRAACSSSLTDLHLLILRFFPLCFEFRILGLSRGQISCVRRLIDGRSMVARLSRCLRGEPPPHAIGRGAATRAPHLQSSGVKEQPWPTHAAGSRLPRDGPLSPHRAMRLHIECPASLPPNARVSKAWEGCDGQCSVTAGASPPRDPGGTLTVPHTTSRGRHRPLRPATW